MYILSYCCEVALSNVQFFKNRLLHNKNFGGQFHETITAVRLFLSLRMNLINK